MIENIVMILFLVFVLILFVKWCLPVLEQEKEQAKKRTTLLDLEIEKLNLEIKKLKG